MKCNLKKNKPKEKKSFLTSKILNSALISTIFMNIFQSIVYADGGADAINKAQSLLTKAAETGGGLWAFWGLVQLGIAIKDSNGPGIQGAIFQIVGGALIIAAGVAISSMNLSMS